ncbi:MAG: GNAT family N-acetyltransferase [Proteobacteria bacterium]|nr:GNAT family N-acetyltransferase [Pseudomonadota bacterium]
MKDRLTIVEACTADEREAYFGLRHQVFVEEQNVPEEIERDSFDELPETRHLLGYVDGKPAATVRVTYPQPGKAKIGRLAVLPDARGSGCARALLETVMKDFPEQGITLAVMSAQSYLQRFYESVGFVVVGEPYKEAGLDHVWMEMPVKEMAA